MEGIELVTTILSASVRAGTCLVYAVIGEILMERSGTLNLGLEGIMLTGALAGFFAASVTQNPWLGLAFAMLCGAILSLLHGLVSITLKAQQVVSGLALTILGMGLCGLLGKDMVGKSGVGFESWNFPLLEKIPFIGRIFFQHDVMVYLSYILIPLAYIFLFKTRPGLELRSVGENPQASETMGLDVYKIRYLYILIGGALAGMGGAYLSLAYNQQWIDNMTAGRGWIAIALVIFARWNPLMGALGSYLFGGIEAIQFRLQAAGSNIPASLLLMLPYIATILVLFFSSLGGMKRSHTPESLGTPYIRGERH